MEMNAQLSEYFNSYEDLEVHRIMLQDKPRTETYKRAILSNKAFFKNKVVMDVGAGTGILSLFIAQAGAYRVYAVEASKVANLAKDVISENDLGHIIEVHNCKVENLVLPQGVKVDVIVSEWMGFYLFHEGMLDSLIVARDKFLKEGGRMFPETAMVYCAPCSLPPLFKTWDKVYGVSMSTFGKAYRSRHKKPEIMVVCADDILADEEALCWIDLRYTTLEEVNQFELEHVTVAKKKGLYQGLCLWFEVRFPNLSGNEDQPYIALSTSPKDEPTHWKHTVIVLPDEQEVDIDEPIAYDLKMARDPSNLRRYHIQVTMLDPDEIDHPLGCRCHLTKCIVTAAYMKEHPEKSPKKTERPEIKENDSPPGSPASKKIKTEHIEEDSMDVDS